MALAIALVAVAAPLGGASAPVDAQEAAPAAAAEEEPARRHAPIVYLKRQAAECDGEGW